MQKIFRLFQIFASYKLFKRTALPYLPERISIEVTNRCCFTCGFCMQSNPEHFKNVAPKMLAPEEAELLLKKIRQAGVTLRTINWTLDGEPFMNKSFADIIEIACSHGFTDHIFSTNGLLALPEVLSRLPKETISYTLYIDFCADPTLFEQIRGTPGSWEKVKNNISAALEDPDLSHLKIRITDISNWQETDPRTLADNRKTLFDMFHGRAAIDYRSFHNMAGYLKDRAMPTSAYNVCPYPWIDFNVACNGDVVACCRDLEHKTVLGNLFEQSLQEIWNGEKYQALREALLEGHAETMEACRHCDMPYDAMKMGMKNIVKSAVGRYQLFKISTNN